MSALLLEDGDLGLREKMASAGNSLSSRCIVQPHRRAGDGGVLVEEAEAAAGACLLS